MAFPSYTDLVKHNRDVGDALLYYFDDIINEKIISEEYVGLSQSEVEQILFRHIDEAEAQTCMMLFASIEGALRYDYEKRLKRPAAGQIDKIVSYWTKSLAPSERIWLTRFKNALRFRNWIAHGRHVLLPVRPANCDIDSLSTLAQEIDRILSSH
jgi:hypothetical protein